MLITGTFTSNKRQFGTSRTASVDVQGIGRIEKKRKEAQACRKPLFEPPQTCKRCVETSQYLNMKSTLAQRFRSCHGSKGEDMTQGLGCRLLDALPCF